MTKLQHNILARGKIILIVSNCGSFLDNLSLNIIVFAIRPIEVPIAKLIIPNQLISIRLVITVTIIDIVAVIKGIKIFPNAKKTRINNSLTDRLKIPTESQIRTFAVMYEDSEVKAPRSKIIFTKGNEKRISIVVKGIIINEIILRFNDTV